MNVWGISFRVGSKIVLSVSSENRNGINNLNLNHLFSVIEFNIDSPIQLNRFYVT
jgi:hypothetical protein